MSEITDPYLYPGTDVLENLRGIYDTEGLAKFEARSTVRRILELRESPTRGQFDTAHLASIHKYIFQDVFAWAGKFRSVNISKAGNSFARADFIGSALDDLFRKLAMEKHLRTLNGPAFAGRAGFFLGEINAVHPFREGNGRTQREFIRQLAAKAGLTVDWSRITRDQMTAASRASFLTGDCSGLVEIIHACLS
jgi:cell filamentation protein